MNDGARDQMIIDIHEGVNRLDKILTGGDEPDEGLVYRHQDTKHRVESLEKEEAKRAWYTRAAILAALSAFVKSFWPPWV